MALAIDCPHCHENRVNSVRHGWYIQGFLIFARYGSKSYIGCDSCTRAKVVTSLAITSLMGWWCFPWGLGTPFVIMQNLGAISSRSSDDELVRLLEAQGVDADDLVLDERGRSRGEVRLVEAVLIVLHRMTWADGSADSREVDVACDIACRMLGARVSADEVRAVLNAETSPGLLNVDRIGPDVQIIILRAACEVARADGVIDPAEIAELRELGAEMFMAPDLVERIASTLQVDDQRAGEDEAMKAIAASVLGVDVDASPADVRVVYHQLLAESAEISDAAEQAERRDQLQFSYMTLLGASAASQAVA